MRQYLGYLYIFMAACFWGLTGPTARFVLADGMTPLEAAFWRAGLGSMFFLTHAAATRGLRLHSKADGLAFALFGAVSLGGFFASYQYAIKMGGAALAAVLLYTAPAWVAVCSRLFFRERITLLKSLAIAVSLAGVMCISLSSIGPAAEPGLEAGALAPGGGVSMAGIMFGLLAGFLYSTHYIFSSSYLRRYSTYTLYGYCTLFGALALLPFVDFAAKSPRDWGVLLILGLVCTYGAYLAYCEGLRRLAPTRAAVLATLEPVVATFFAWWLWGENFAFTGWVGAALVMAAVLILVLDPEKK
ncbi:EamA family transporter [Desulfovibrio sp. OttesenSCG-928-A18]|nr:EamA family transporter [Desulfovibrio sp. OttesenSCG-928-A18]